MNCSDTQYLIHAHIDGELDIVRSLEIEAHIKDCPVCAESHRNLQALRTAMGKLYRKPSPNLAKKISTALRETEQPAKKPRVIPFAIPFNKQSQWLGIAASLVIILFAGLMVIRMISVPSANELLTREIVAGHVRSLMANHLTDVLSTDQHTVKPWFNGKLDFSPPVQDFTAQGFAIVGGRLDYLNNRSVAAVVYQHRQHLINLFIWPTTDTTNNGEITETQQGYNLIHWTKAGNSYWCISDLNKNELQDLVKLLKAS